MEVYQTDPVHRSGPALHMLALRLTKGEQNTARNLEGASLLMLVTQRQGVVQFHVSDY